jgi:hypothetical protein
MTDRQQALADLEAIREPGKWLEGERAKALARLIGFIKACDPAETERLRKERDEWEATARAERDGLMEWHAEAGRLERELARLRADRDAIKGYADHRSRFADRVWAELAAAREALTRIAGTPSKNSSAEAREMARYSNAALSASEQPTLREPGGTGDEWPRCICRYLELRQAGLDADPACPVHGLHPEPSPHVADRDPAAPSPHA